MQARLERSTLGQAVISLLVVAVVGAILVINMPDSQLKRDLGRVTTPLVNATGLDQNWGIFAAPRTISAYVDAHVRFSNGTTSVVKLPTGSGIAAYANYRWQKYEEVLRPDDGKPYWNAYAQYVANGARKSGKQPVQVSLVRRWAETRPPGPGPAHGPWQEYTFYVLNVTGTQ